MNSVQRPQEPMRQEFIAVGKKVYTLCQNLEQKNRHPVLIFGSASGGKTQLILSLIQCLQTSNTVDVSLGDPILDPGDSRSEERHRYAENIYSQQSFTLDIGSEIPATQVQQPFFIPIDLQPKDSESPPVKIALLEGRGEDYMPNLERSQDFYKPVSPEIIDIFQNFSNGMTIIYAAPYSMSGSGERDTESGNYGLLNVLQAYRKNRTMRLRDFHIFLLTKWDQYAQPMNRSKLFEDPWPTDVDDVLRDRYHRSWGEFQALPLENNAKHRRAFMQYSAGHFVDGQRTRPPQRFEATYNRYSRILANWIYGNATQVNVESVSGEMSIRKVLFDDVTAPGAPKVTLSEKAASVLFAGTVRRPW